MERDKEYYIQKTKALKILLISIIIISIILYITVILIFQNKIVPNYLRVNDKQCAQTGLNIGSKCNDLLKLWCLNNESTRERIRIKLEDNLKGIARENELYFKGEPRE